MESKKETINNLISLLSSLSGKELLKAISLLKEVLNSTQDEFLIADSIKTLQNINLPECFEIVISQKKSKSEQVRKAVLEAAAWCGNEKALPILADYLLDNEEGIRERCLEMLCILLRNYKKKDKKVYLDKIKGMLEDQSPDVRSMALITLYMIDRSKYFNDIIKCLSDPDPLVRSSALERLSGGKFPDINEKREMTETEIPINEKLTVDHIMPLLKDPDEEIRETAMEIYTKLKGDKSDNFIIDNLKDTDEFVRAKALELLKESKLSMCYEKSIEALNDYSEIVREQAVENLTEMKNKEAIPALIKSFHKEQNADLKNEIAEALIENEDIKAIDTYYLIAHEEIGNQWDDALDLLIKYNDNRAIILLREKIKSATDSNLAKLTLALGLVGDKADIATITALLTHKNNTVRANAALALGHIGDATSIDSLKKLLKDQHLSVRINAARSIGFIQKDEESKKKLIKILEELDVKKMDKWENEEYWGYLDGLDGLLEMKVTNLYTDKLKAFYKNIDKKLTFPLRAAWERLRIAGINIKHPVFIKGNPIIPYPWPSIKGPYLLN